MYKWEFEITMFRTTREINHSFKAVRRVFECQSLCIFVSLTLPKQLNRLSSNILLVWRWFRLKKRENCFDFITYLRHLCPAIFRLVSLNHQLFQGIFSTLVQATVVKKKVSGSSPTWWSCSAVVTSVCFKCYCRCEIIINYWLSTKVIYNQRNDRIFASTLVLMIYIFRIGYL